jgi:hypothetical protein
LHFEDGVALGVLHSLGAGAKCRNQPQQSGFYNSFISVIYIVSSEKLCHDSFTYFINDRHGTATAAAMEPCSILELSTTVIKLSAAVYGFFKDVHNAPRDVTEYLLVLEGSRKIFVDVQQYADLHEQSAFTKVHRNQLDTLTVVLEECQLSFGTQVSLIESYRSGCSELNFQKLRKRCEWVFGRDAIQSAGAKLQSSQTLLIQALNVSSGYVPWYMISYSKKDTYNFKTRHCIHSRSCGFRASQS